MNQKLRSILDGLGKADLLQLRKDVRATPEGSMQEIEGVQVTKDQALKLINQALPVDNS